MLRHIVTHEIVASDLYYTFTFLNNNFYYFPMGLKFATLERNEINKKIILLHHYTN